MSDPKSLECPNCFLQFHQTHADSIYSDIESRWKSFVRLLQQEIKSLEADHAACTSEKEKLERILHDVKVVINGEACFLEKCSSGFSRFNAACYSRELSSVGTKCKFRDYQDDVQKVRAGLTQYQGAVLQCQKLLENEPS